MWTGFGQLIPVSGSKTLSKKEVEYNLLRKFLPYGMWTLEDGTQILFNRDYEPLWSRQSTIRGDFIPIERNEWISHAQQEHFFNDENPPWYNTNTLKKCGNILMEWGVFDKPKKG